MSDRWRRRREAESPVRRLRRDFAGNSPDGNRIVQGLRWAYRTRVGDVLRVLFPIALGAYPLVHDFGLLPNRGWLWWWLGGFVGNELLNLYLRGLATDKGRDRLHDTATDLAGNIENFAQLLISSSNRRLPTEGAKGLCVGYLARIQGFAERACTDGVSVQIRATLALPVGPNGREPIGLRTWCYDRPYSNRRWSLIAMDREGSPEAFLSGRERIIDDIERLGTSPETRDRPFRSVFCIPVTAGGENGKRLAVVNIDATLPGFFAPERIRTFRALIAPAVSMIAVTLLTMQEDAAYEFNS